MPGAPEILRILPIIIRLFPRLAQTRMIRGLIVPLNNVKPSNDEDLARDLNRQIRVPRRTDGNKDSSYVIKVSDAIDCCTAGFNNTTLILEFVKVAAKSLIEERTRRACGQSMAEKMIQCMREKALNQFNARQGTTTIRSHRPSEGHGYGRGKHHA